MILTRLLSDFVYEVSVTDPATFALLLFARGGGSVGLLFSLGGARRRSIRW